MPLDRVPRIVVITPMQAHLEPGNGFLDSNCGSFEQHGGDVSLNPERGILGANNGRLDTSCDSLNTNKDHAIISDSLNTDKDHVIISDGLNFNGEGDYKISHLVPTYDNDKSSDSYMNPNVVPLESKSASEDFCDPLEDLDSAQMGSLPVWNDQAEVRPCANEKTGQLPRDVVLTNSGQADSCSWKSSENSLESLQADLSNKVGNGGIIQNLQLKAQND